MTGIKHSTWKTLSAVAALALLLPRLALGEFGVCPPYSKTFGPEDPEDEIWAFLDEIDSRPGGGTLVLEPGYYFYEPISNSGSLGIDGVVCIRSSEPDSEQASMYVRLSVRPGAMLTLRGVSLSAQTDVSGHRVDEGATLFADHVGLGFQGVDETADAFLENAGTAYLNEVTIGGDEGFSGIENTGTLVMTGGGISVWNILSFDALRNHGYAMLDRVSIEDNLSIGGSVRGIVNYAGGVLVLQNSVVADNESAYMFCGGSDNVGIVNEAGGFVHAFSSTVANNLNEDESCEYLPGTGIRNAGQLELENSVVTDACDPITDRGYNVGTCAATHPTSIEGDPKLMPDEVELSGISPAIDLIPLERCPPTDGLGRARTDGNSDGAVACDAGAREYGYAGVEVVVRTTPYWRTVGKVDLSRTNALFVVVMSGGPIDPTTILFDSVEVGAFPYSALRGIAYGDKNGDGLPDYVVWYRLDKDLALECRYYDEPFSARTDDGQRVAGWLQFEVVGCTP